MSNNTI